MYLTVRKNSNQIGQKCSKMWKSAKILWDLWRVSVFVMLSPINYFAVFEPVLSIRFMFCYAMLFSANGLLALQLRNRRWSSAWWMEGVRWQSQINTISTILTSMPAVPSMGCCHKCRDSVKIVVTTTTSSLQWFMSESLGRKKGWSDF